MPRFLLCTRPNRSHPWRPVQLYRHRGMAYRRTLSMHAIGHQTKITPVTLA